MVFCTTYSKRQDLFPYLGFFRIIFRDALKESCLKYQPNQLLFHLARIQNYTEQKDWSTGENGKLNSYQPAKVDQFSKNPPQNFTLANHAIWKNGNWERWDIIWSLWWVLFGGGWIFWLHEFSAAFTQVSQSKTRLIVAQHLVKHRYCFGMLSK